MTRQPTGTPTGIHDEEPDDGLRKLLTWTFIALGATLVLAAIGVSLVVYWFA